MREYVREDFPDPLVVEGDWIRQATPLPEGLADALDAWEKAWATYAEADASREDAEGALQNASNADMEKLRAAILAKKGDPGTKATDAANRAAIVAQETLRLAHADLRLALDNVWKILTDNRDTLLVNAAEAELRTLEEFREETKVAQAALARLTQIARCVGGTYNEIDSYLTRGGGPILNPNWPNFSDPIINGQSVAGWYEHKIASVKEAQG